MSLFHGKVLSGKLAGNLIDTDMFGATLTIGITPICKGDITSYSMIGSTNKMNIGFMPVKGYYQVLINWAGGETSIIEIDAKAFGALSYCV